jgi:hypothetical protein
MKQKLSTLTAFGFSLIAATAYAGGGGFAGAGAFSTVEGWLTGSIAEFAGVCAIVALGILIWLAHEYGHAFMQVFRAIVAIAFIVFALTIYTTAFGAGATIGVHSRTGISAR